MNMVIRKVLYLIKTIALKISYKQNIEITGLPKIEMNCRIRIDDGVLNISKGATIREGGYISLQDGAKITIGQNVSINRNISIVSRLKVDIGNECIIGPNVTIYDHDHSFDYDGYKEGYKKGEVVIEPHTWIGANVVILRGTRIGSNSIIGAGSIVSGIIPPHSLVVSNRDLIVQKIENRRDGEKE